MELNNVKQKQSNPSEPVVPIVWCRLTQQRRWCVCNTLESCTAMCSLEKLHALKVGEAQIALTCSALTFFMYYLLFHMKWEMWSCTVEYLSEFNHLPGFRKCLVFFTIQFPFYSLPAFLDLPLSLISALPLQWKDLL